MKVLLSICSRLGGPFPNGGCSSHSFLSVPTTSTFRVSSAPKVGAPATACCLFRAPAHSECQAPESLQLPDRHNRGWEEHSRMVGAPASAFCRFRALVHQAWPLLQSIIFSYFARTVFYLKFLNRSRACEGWAGAVVYAQSLKLYPLTECPQLRRSDMTGMSRRNVCSWRYVEIQTEAPPIRPRLERRRRWFYGADPIGRSNCPFYYDHRQHDGLRPGRRKRRAVAPCLGA